MTSFRAAMQAISKLKNMEMSRTDDTKEFNVPELHASRHAWCGAISSCQAQEHMRLTCRPGARRRCLPGAARLAPPAPAGSSAGQRPAPGAPPLQCPGPCLGYSQGCPLPAAAQSHIPTSQPLPSQCCWFTMSAAVSKH